jgi:hypothetical protein
VSKSCKGASDDAGPHGGGDRDASAEEDGGEDDDAGGDGGASDAADGGTDSAEPVYLCCATSGGMCGEAAGYCTCDPGVPGDCANEILPGETATPSCAAFDCCIREGDGACNCASAAELACTNHTCAEYVANSGWPQATNCP